MTKKWSRGKSDLVQVTGEFEVTKFELAGFHRKFGIVVFKFSK